MTVDMASDAFDLQAFLRESTGDDQLFLTLQSEKIDEDALRIMSDEELKEYFQKHGDRLRLRNFLRVTRKASQSTQGKGKLLDILRQKMETRSRKKNGTQDAQSLDDESLPRMMKRHFGNKNASRTTRKIEIGWIHKDSDVSVHMRAKKGGGKRSIKVSKDTTKKDILELGLKYFFKNGESNKGSVSMFNFDVWDYQERSLDETITVGQMYAETGLSTLRFYLASIDRTEDGAGKNNGATEDDGNCVTLQGATSMNKMDSLPDLSVLPEAPDVYCALDNHYQLQDNIVEAAAKMSGIWGEDQEQTPNEEDYEQTQCFGEREHDFTHHSLRLHRGQLLIEMRESFQLIDPYTDLVDILMIMPDGKPEPAEDGGGVTRDALSEFWTAFYNECTVGNTSKVPYIRHDYRGKWEAISNIIVYGWRQCEYWPIQLSLAFVEQCLFGNVFTDITEDFLSTLPVSDASVLNAALSDISLVEQDDLLDVLDNHEVKVSPTKENIHRVLEEVAHKEIIQSSMYIIDCWGPVLSRIGISSEQLVEVYNTRIPTNRGVMKLLKFPEEMSQNQSAVANHLKRFIRELDSMMLGRFLRFCTGSDQLLCPKIEVAFVTLHGVWRRPVAHTCSCLLELPHAYENYPVFMAEFTSVLNSCVCSELLCLGNGHNLKWVL